jgi:hypothetical protein
MAVLVWFMVGIALWHFTVFLPDHFWGGIVGALLGAIVGAIVTGAVEQIASGHTIGQTDIVTLIAAVPGTLIGLAVVYFIGARNDALEGIERMPL